MFYEFRSSENQPRSSETDRGFNKTIWKKFDRLKISFDRLKQSEALSNIFKKISIDRKIEWINRNGQRLTKYEEKHSFLKKKKKIQNQLKAFKFKSNMHEYVMMWFSKTRILSPNFPKIKFLAFSINFQATN